MADPMENPPPIPAVPLAYYAQPYVRRRPVLLSIIAWVAIVFGGLGSLGILSSIFILVAEHYTGIFGGFAGPSASGGTPDFLYYIAIINLISGIASIPLLIGGIKTLGLKPIGRKLLIGYGIYSLVFSVVSAVVSYKVVTPMMNGFVAQTVNGATTAPTTTTTATTTTTTANGTSVTTVNMTTNATAGTPPNISWITLVQQVAWVAVDYAVVIAILYYLMRPEIKQLFQQTPPIAGSWDTNQRTQS